MPWPYPRLIAPSRAKKNPNQLSRDVADPLARHVHLALHPRHVLVQQAQHLVLHHQLLLDLHAQLLLPRHGARQRHHVLVLLPHHLRLQLLHAHVVERARPVRLPAQDAARRRLRGPAAEEEGGAVGFLGDGLVGGGLGGHGGEQGVEAVLFALGAREEVAAAAELAVAEPGASPGRGRGEGVEARGEGLEHGAGSDEGLLGLGRGFVLGLRGGGLVPAREVEAGVVELGFQVAVVVEPDDGVRDRVLGAGSVEGGVEGG